MTLATVKNGSRAQRNRSHVSPPSTERFTAMPSGLQSAQLPSPFGPKRPRASAKARMVPLRVWTMDGMRKQLICLWCCVCVCVCVCVVVEGRGVVVSFHNKDGCHTLYRAAHSWPHLPWVVVQPYRCCYCLVVPAPNDTSAHIHTPRAHVHTPLRRTTKHVRCTPWPSRCRPGKTRQSG